jgi:hypothetical protein
MAYSILQNMAECVLAVRFLPTEPRNLLQGLKCGHVFLRSICLVCESAVTYSILYGIPCTLSLVGKNDTTTPGDWDQTRVYSWVQKKKNIRTTSF